MDGVSRFPLTRLGLCYFPSPSRNRREYTNLTSRRPANARGSSAVCNKQQTVNAGQDIP